MDCALEKPDASALADDELYRLTMMNTPDIPTQALSEVWIEWDRRHLRVKVYRDTAPKKRR